MKPRTNLELHKYSGYASGLYFLPSTIKALRVQLQDGSTREITHPKLSRDFVSGILEDSKTKGYFRRSCIASVEFLNDEKDDLPELCFTRKALGEQLLEIQLPALFRLSYREGSAAFQKVLVVGIFRGFLVTDSELNKAIPLAALGAIEIDCA
jgi:hypothetical protein